MGHVLLDCIAAVPEGFFARHGLFSSPVHVAPEVMDELCADLPGLRDVPAAPDVPRAKFPSVHWSAGGGAAVTAKAARAMNLDVDLWGSIGRDARGALLQEELESSGLAFHPNYSPKPTGIFCSFKAGNSEKRIVVSPSAARDIRLAAIPDEALVPGWILYVDGLLIDCPEWLSDLSVRARKRGMRIAMDVSTPGNAKRFCREIRRFAESWCDYVFANEAEFAALQAGSDGTLSPRVHWIVKRGEKGARCIHGCRTFEAAAAKTDALDETGAGDAFSAGFLYGLVNGFGIEKCLRFGNAAASVIVRTPGSSFSAASMMKAVADIDI